MGSDGNRCIPIVVLATMIVASIGLTILINYVPIVYSKGDEEDAESGTYFTLWELCETVDSTDFIAQFDCEANGNIALSVAFVKVLLIVCETLVVGEAIVMILAKFGMRCAARFGGWIYLVLSFLAAACAMGASALIFSKVYPYTRTLKGSFPPFLAVGVAILQLVSAVLGKLLL